MRPAGQDGVTVGAGVVSDGQAVMTWSHAGLVALFVLAAIASVVVLVLFFWGSVICWRRR
jgi:hypothetical protein